MPSASNASWKEAVGVIWENFTGVRGGSAALRALVFVLLLAGTVFAVRCYARVAGAGRRLDELHGAAEEDARMRGVTERARSIRLRRAAPAAAFTGIAHSDGDLFEHPMGFEETPPPAAQPASAAVPDITVRGVMRLGGRSVAIVDVRGGETGKVVKARDSFSCMGRAVLVTSVSGKGLSVRWNGLDLTFPLN